MRSQPPERAFCDSFALADPLVSAELPNFALFRVDSLDRASYHSIEMDTDLRRIVEQTQRSNRIYEARLKQLVSNARDRIPAIVDEIRRIDPELSTVILFGSFARDSVRSQDFDIDLAISSSRIFQIAAWSEDQDLPLDIVDLDSLSAEFRSVVEKEGVVLYAKTL